VKIEREAERICCAKKKAFFITDAEKEKIAFKKCFKTQRLRILCAFN